MRASLPVFAKTIFSVEVAVDLKDCCPTHDADTQWEEIYQG